MPTAGSTRNGGYRRRDDDPAAPARLHVARRRTHRGEYSGQVDVDGPLPALVAVVLERAFRRTAAIRSEPGAEKPRTGIDAGIGKGDIEATVAGGRFVEGPVQGRMVGDIDDLAVDIETRGSQSPGLVGDTAGVAVEQGHARAVRSKRLDISQSDAARTASDDHSISADVEQLRDLHAWFPMLTGGYRAAPDARFLPRRARLYRIQRTRGIARAE